MISVSGLVKVSCNLYVGSKITFFFQSFKQFSLASATLFPFIYSMATKIFKTAETELNSGGNPEEVKFIQQSPPKSQVSGQLKMETCASENRRIPLESLES